VSELFVEVTRGPLVESAHAIAACAIDRLGRTILEVGDIDAPVYLRSTAKPFIAAAAVRAGVVERFGLESREVAVMAASHAGESFHVERVRSILKKIGLPESALQCGPHAPYNASAAAELVRRGEAFSAIHNNCSGKHAGILALCVVLGSDPATYMDVNNGAEQEILAFCARATDAAPAELTLGIDGCGIPVFAVPLRQAALAFMRFATLGGLAEPDARALETVRSAMVQHPLYVAGTGEFDSVLMEVLEGVHACKGGAEGVHGDAALRAGLGLVVKVLDGARRAVAPAVIELLDELGVLDRHVREQLEGFAAPNIVNRAGRVVGAIRTRRAMSPKTRTS